MNQDKVNAKVVERFFEKLVAYQRKTGATEMGLCAQFGIERSTIARAKHRSKISKPALASVVYPLVAKHLGYESAADMMQECLNELVREQKVPASSDSPLCHEELYATCEVLDTVVLKRTENKELASVKKRALTVLGHAQPIQGGVVLSTSHYRQLMMLMEK